MRPVFIVGMPRTGTTILHDILAQDPANRAPLTWETMFPSPPPETASRDDDPRIARCAGDLPAVDAQIPAFKAMHPMGATLSQECVTMMGETHVHAPLPQPVPRARVPGLGRPRRRLVGTSTTSIRSSSSTCGRAKPRDRWVLKTGAHMWGLEHLLRTYPDARIVFTHRDPVKSMTSYASLTALVRSMGSDEVDPIEIAADWTPRIETRARARDRGPQRGAPIRTPRFYDMYFPDFVADQFAEVEKIYDALGLPMTGAGAERMRAFIADNPKGKHGIHRYAPEEFGVDRDRAPWRVPALHGALRTRARSALTSPIRRSLACPMRAPRPGRCAPGASTSTAIDPPTRCSSTRIDVPDARARRAARARAGDPAQPERPRAHQRRQHDGAPRAARTAPGMEMMGIVDRVRRRAPRPGTAGASSRCRRPRTAASPSTRSARRSRPSRCPTTIPLPDAAALYFPFHLAWLGLFDRAELPAGETVLIHAAAGGSGSAAIQLALHAAPGSSRPSAPTRRSQLCRDLGADVVINYDRGGLPSIVLEQTGGQGVDVVFDNVGEAVMEKSIKALAYNGRYVMMGFASDKSRGRREADRAPQHRGRELQALRRAALVRRRRAGRR